VNRADSPSKSLAGAGNVGQSRAKTDLRSAGTDAPTPSVLTAYPESAEDRRRIRDEATLRIEQSPPGSRLTYQTLLQNGQAVLSQQSLREDYLGYAMVSLRNAAARPRFLAVPISHRLLLLPPTKELSRSLESLVERARELGYQVLVADRISELVQRLAQGEIAAILGMAFLPDLEKALAQVELLGIPAYAIAIGTTLDGEPTFDQRDVDSVLDEVISGHTSERESYLPLLRRANELFGEPLDRLVPRTRSRTIQESRSPLGLTESVALDWLIHGGKRFRPFITLAAYEAATRDRDLPDSSAPRDFHYSDGVCRVAIAIEAFHKASLVHDDIQDDDLFRYGRDTLHRSQGLGPAINIGDFLIGLGYQLVNGCRGDVGAEAAGDIVDNMSQAHLRLCHGQGAEMAWRDHPDWRLTTSDAVQIYALKTSPAFEAALYAGLRLAGPVTSPELVSRFCEQLGIGFQVLNDLKDWAGDQDNKLIAGQDALALRPTVILAMALESANESQRAEIRELMESSSDDAFRLDRLRALFTSLGVFAAAERLVEESRRTALELATAASPAPVRMLLKFLVDQVLEESVAPVAPGALQSAQA
jgi:geranylgeranyl pyrophosphate synthase